MKKKEAERDRIVNPERNRQADIAYLEDKAGVDKRRRDRYVMYFVEKDAKEAALREVGDS